MNSTNSASLKTWTMNVQYSQCHQCLFKTIFQAKLSHWLEALSPRRHNQWNCRPEFYPVPHKQPSEDHHPNRTPLTQSSVTLVIWKMHVQGLPSVTDQKPFPHHLSSKTIVSTWWSLSPGRPEKWTCRDFHTVSDEWPFQYHLPSRALLTWALSLWQPEQWICRVFTSITDEWPF